MGLSQHLCLFYHIALGHADEHGAAQPWAVWLFSHAHVYLTSDSPYKPNKGREINFPALGAAEFLEYIPHLREYFVHPAEVEGGRYVVPRAAGASTSIVSEVAAAAIMAKGEPTIMAEGDTWLGDE